MKLTIEAKRKYLLNPVYCPFCQSDNITTMELTNNGPVLEVEVSCKGCGEEWDEIYQIRDMRHTNEEEVSAKPSPRAYIPGYA